MHEILLIMVHVVKGPVSMVETKNLPVEATGKEEPLPPLCFRPNKKRISTMVYLNFDHFQPLRLCSEPLPPFRSL